MQLRDAQRNRTAAGVPVPLPVAVAPGLAALAALDDKYTTNPCIGGVDRRTAFVTLSMTGRIVALDSPRRGSPAHFTR